MKSLEQLLAGKPHRLLSVAADATVLQALHLLAKHDIGALLVMDGDRPVGIFSERDYARKVILHGRSSADTRVSEVMSEHLITVPLTERVEVCMEIMTEKHVRHLPVLAADGTVAGFLSIGDLVKEVISEQQFVIGQLEHYITH
ncbi:CBS domain-containing protein [Mesoterricola sediminis]|uniref:Histidine kinase n=1 Tax=Mesoterricola sediminis TaxID=2927980 RepID=A0AA48H0K7_9BACT|nr:CBS domain-containing protein [Mesoterricola sediminis]BDU77805.1 histidine kinase [Mesoterricola sediminis]